MAMRDMDLDRIQTVIRAAMVAMVALWHALPELTQLLVWLMVIDTALGLAVAVKQRNLSPTLAWSGATKKLGALLMVGLAAVLDRYVQQDVVDFVQAASAFYIVPELTSIMRNAALMDVPVFVQLKDVLRYFQSSASGEGNKR